MPCKTSLKHGEPIDWSGQLPGRREHRRQSSLEFTGLMIRSGLVEGRLIFGDMAKGKWDD